MKSLIIVAHGSKINSSNEEIKNLVSQMKKENYIIKYAFLELAKPTLNDVVQELIKEGIEEIDIFPYFLAAGKHVKKDIPNQVKEIKSLHKNLKVELLEHLGKTQGLIDIILNASLKTK